jgi:hypothetical protein
MLIEKKSGKYACSYFEKEKNPPAYAIQPWTMKMAWTSLLRDFYDVATYGEIVATQTRTHEALSGFFTCITLGKSYIRAHLMKRWKLGLNQTSLYNFRSGTSSVVYMFVFWFITTSFNLEALKYNS